MKRILSMLLALVLVIGMIPVQASAETLDNGLEYEVCEDHVEITGYTGSATEVVIPAEIEGLPVTAIGEKSFYKCNTLTSITFPDSITTIGDWAFHQCEGLNGIVIPDGVSSIGEQAFSYCKSLTGIVIPEGVTYIDDLAFAFCESLTGIHVDENNPNYSSDDRGVFFDKEKTKLILAPGAITGSYAIPDGVTHIGDYAFAFCANLTGIDIPSSVTYLGDVAFYWCTSLTDVNIANGVTYIGQHNFSFCENLTHIVIPDSVKHINYSAFSYNYRLTSIRFEGDPPRFSTGIFYTTIATVYYPAGNAAWTELEKWTYGGNIVWVPLDPNHTHDFSSVVTDPTCTERGFTTYSCDCGGRHLVDYVAALGHDYIDGVCTRCDEVDPYYNDPFSDVHMDSFFYEPVLWAVENGITNGTSENSFSPDDQCQRAHVVTFLWRANGCPEPTTNNNPFTDVKEGDFFYEAVLWAVEKGITNGTGGTTFGSYDVCNRAQVVTFLHRAMGSPTPASTELLFTDVSADAWYAAPVAWAVENGITNGLTATEFGPDASCNRAQVVTLLYRAYN